MDRILLGHLLKKISIMGPFSREQISFKEKFRIDEDLDMQRASEKIVDFFIKRNGEDPDNYDVTVVRVSPDLYDEDYGWHSGTAQGIIRGEKESFPFTVNLTDGEVWTVTLGA